MSTKIDYTPLSGGLDLVSGALNVRAGRLSECMNFEQVFGKQGYKRIDGYERFDGRPEPHRAQYSIQKIKNLVTTITVGETITGNSVIAEVLEVDGLNLVLLASGRFDSDENIKVGGAARAQADGATELGEISRNSAHVALAQNATRSKITSVPGSGRVLGVAVYRGNVFAARNNTNGTTAAIYKSSPDGWVLIKSGLLPGGRFDFEVANFSGTGKTLSLFGCDGKNPPFRWDGAYTAMEPIYGSQATSVTSLAVGNGSKAFAYAQPTRSYKIGDKLLAVSRANAANTMTGVVTAIAAAMVTINMTSFTGSGTFTDWDISLASFEDKPHLVTAHKDFLFLGYPLGQLQSSNIGDPMAYTNTAAAFALGDTITGLTSMRGSVLGVFCSNRISMLSGTSNQDWKMDPYSKSAGARLGTIQESGGNALFLDGRGLTSLQATQSFGDFEPSIFSREVKPFLDKIIFSVVASRVAKVKFQYRMYAGKTVLTAAILSPDAMIQPKAVAFTQWKYAHEICCVAQGDIDGGEDAMFFGTADGFVMREDVGTSFDGDIVPSAIRLHFNHLKSPANKKRFRKLEIELDTSEKVQIRFRQQFNYADGFYDASLTQHANAIGVGGQWDASEWNLFFWSQALNNKIETNIDGVGRNMGLLLWHESATDSPFTLQGILLQYSILGLAR